MLKFIGKGSAVLLCAAVLSAACTPKAPDIDVTTEYDLGTVVKGALAAADIPVVNAGEGRLTVYGISTSCGCTKATLSSMTIAPGDAASLHIVYDSAAHETDLGLIERFVFISSDDPDEDEVRVKLTIFVEERLQ